MLLLQQPAGTACIRVSFFTCAAAALIDQKSAHCLSACTSACNWLMQPLLCIQCRPVLSQHRCTISFLCPAESMRSALVHLRESCHSCCHASAWQLWCMLALLFCRFVSQRSSSMLLPAFCNMTALAVLPVKLATHSPSFPVGTYLKFPGAG